VVKAAQLGIPMPCLSSALAYFDGYRSDRLLPANLLQAQQDFYPVPRGLRTRTPRETWRAYERVDKPRGEFFHTNWTGRGGTTTSQTYVV
jgi:6-phosphogluconate dehydrogenase